MNNFKTFFTQDLCVLYKILHPSAENLFNSLTTVPTAPQQGEWDSPLTTPTKIALVHF